MSSASTPTLYSRSNLRPYQTRAVNRLKGGSTLFIAAPGSGKTATALTAIKDLLDTGRIKRALISAPLRVASHVWPREPSKWEHLRDLEVVSIAGLPPAARHTILEGDAPVVAVNPELMPKIAKLMKERGDTFGFDALIIDESRGWQDAGSQRFKSWRHLMPDFSYRWAMTGTPGPLLSLWTQVFIADCGRTLGRSVYAYEQSFFDKEPFGYKLFPKEGAEETIMRAIETVACRIDESELAVLPPINELRHEVSLPVEAVEVYEQLVQEFFVELGDQPITAANAAVLAGKLRQLTQGALYHPDQSYHAVHTAKLDALDELLSEFGDEPTIVCYQFRFELDILRHRYPHARAFDGLGTKATAALIDDFASGKVPLLLGHPGSFGHGVDGLQHGGRRMVFLGEPWSHDARLQTVSRLARSGQEHPVFIHSIHAGHTIDDDVAAALSDKGDTESRLIAAIRRLK